MALNFCTNVYENKKMEIYVLITYIVQNMYENIWIFLVYIRFLACNDKMPSDKKLLLF